RWSTRGGSSASCPSATSSRPSAINSRASSTRSRRSSSATRRAGALDGEAGDPGRAPACRDHRSGAHRLLRGRPPAPAGPRHGRGGHVRPAPDTVRPRPARRRAGPSEVGVGNVAVDVARILCRTREELATTDIADYALEALSRSRIKEVYLLGRRGPAQAAFTNPEIKELGELAGADIEVRPDEVELDPLSRAALERSHDRATAKKVEILQGYAVRPATGKPRRLSVRFLVSPVELVGDASDRVVKLRLVRNELVATPTGAL